MVVSFPSVAEAAASLRLPLAVRCDSLRTGQLRPPAAVQTAGLDGRRRAAYLGIARVPDGGSESRASGENRVPEVDPGDCLRPSALLVAHARSATDEWPSAVPADDCFATKAIASTVTTGAIGLATRDSSGDRSERGRRGSRGAAARAARV